MSNLFSYVAGVSTMLAVYLDKGWVLLTLGCLVVVVADTAWKRQWSKDED